jgi:hypothetical protein
MERTPLGRLVHTMYKSPQIRLVTGTADGQTRAFQLVPALGSAGFLLSPLVLHTIEFAELYRSEDHQSSDWAREVKSIAIDSPEAPGWFWKPRVRVRLSALSLPAGRRLVALPEAERLIGLAALGQGMESCLFLPQLEPLRQSGPLALTVHAPCRLRRPVPRASRGVRVVFGLRESGWTGAEHSDGAAFRITAIAQGQGGTNQVRMRMLDPAAVVGDRGDQRIVLEWPAGSVSALQIETLPGPSGNPGYDHTYVSELTFLPER